MENNNINTLINNIKTIKDVVETIVEMYNTINHLKEEVVTLKEEINKIKETKVVVKDTIKQHNIENRKYTPQTIRYIFYLHLNKNMSGYKISKLMNENTPFIYNILNRKIYQDVNISNLSEEDSKIVE